LAHASASTARLSADSYPFDTILCQTAADFPEPVQGSKYWYNVQAYLSADSPKVNAFEMQSKVGTMSAVQYTTVQLFCSYHGNGSLQKRQLLWIITA